MTIKFLPENHPSTLGPMREWEDRNRLAAHITHTLFTVSPRTIETWPLQWTIVHRKALARTGEAVAYAKQVLAEAEANRVRGGRAA